MNNRYLYILLASMFGLIWSSSCSTTKLIPEGEVLYTGVKKITIVSDSAADKIPGDVESAIKEPLSVAPNNPLFSPYVRTPFPIGLWAYNTFKTDKTKGFKHWMFAKFAKEPVLISKVQPDIRVKAVENILNNYGYFGSQASYELLPDKRNPQKARVNYTVNVAPPVRYGEIEYRFPETPLGTLIDSTRYSSLLQTGKQYNADTLAMERSRIASLARGRGYYFFRPEYVEYLADSTLHPRQIALRLVPQKGIPEVALRKYFVGNIQVVLQPVVPTSQPFDTIQAGEFTILTHQPLKVRKSVLRRSIEMRRGDLFDATAPEKSLSNLNKLDIFRYVNMDVTPIDSIGNSDSLNVSIQAQFDTPLEAEFEVDVSSKSNNFIGPGVIFGLNRKNVFGGGEKLSVRLNGAYEWQTGKQPAGSKSSLLNSYEFGLNSTLAIPRLLAPRVITRRNRYPARTSFQLGADLMNRPKYFRMLSFNGSAFFDFQTSPTRYHTLTPFKLVYNNLLNLSAEFNQTLEENPALALSFRNQFIPSMSYSYTIDKTYGPNNGKRLFWQNSITEAGNILSVVTHCLGQRGADKKLFGSTFSQFIKAVSEFKYYKKTRKNDWIASRILVGIEHAYGNSSVVPYSEQFYIGGANSIRAFTIRSLGPGSYKPSADNANAFLDQTGTFKLELNTEWRFNIYNRLNGALFVDAGNIWLLKKDPMRPGGELTMKNFFEEIAVGTGFGFRYDISYLVLRADLGIAIHAPYKTDKKGYYNIESFGKGLGFHLAIGYPF